MGITRGGRLPGRMRPISDQKKLHLMRRYMDFVKRSAEQECWKPEKDAWMGCPTRALFDPAGNR